MLTLFRAADLHEERVRILRVLGAVRQPELIKRVLEFSLSDEVRSQVRGFSLVSLSVLVSALLFFPIVLR